MNLGLLTLIFIIDISGLLFLVLSQKYMQPDRFYWGYLGNYPNIFVLLLNM